MTLIRLQSRMLIPSLALVVPLLAACTTVTEERGGPQAPGIGFEAAPAVVDRTDRQHAPLTPMAQDRKSTRLHSSHVSEPRMPSSA